MIRPTIAEDKDALLALAQATGIFEIEQLDELAEMLSQYFSGDSDGLWLTDYDAEPVGMAYFAPERMTEGTWNLYLLAVHPRSQRQGRGAALVNYVEQVLKKEQVRLLLVETAGTDDFEYVREFYLQNGFQKEAKIREFYTKGVDKVIFRKALTVV